MNSEKKNKPVVRNNAAGKPKVAIPYHGADGSKCLGVMYGKQHPLMRFVKGVTVKDEDK